MIPPTTSPRARMPATIQPQGGSLSGSSLVAAAAPAATAAPVPFDVVVVTVVGVAAVAVAVVVVVVVAVVVVGVVTVLVSVVAGAVDVFVSVRTGEVAVLVAAAAVSVSVGVATVVDLAAVAVRVDCEAPLAICAVPLPVPAPQPEVTTAAHRRILAVALKGIDRSRDRRSLLRLRLLDLACELVGGHVGLPRDHPVCRLDVRRDLVGHVRGVDDDQPCAALVENLAELLQVAAVHTAVHMARDRADRRAGAAADGERADDSDRREERCDRAGSETPLREVSGLVTGRLLVLLHDLDLAVVLFRDDGRIEVR